MKETNTNLNPFAGIGTADTKESGFKKLDHTPELMNTSNRRAHEALVAMPKKPELFATANTVLDNGTYPEAVNLLTQIIGQDVISEDAKFLNDATDEELSSLLESRRSDRSKTKAKGLRSNIQITEKFLSCVYAEMLVRIASGKEYNPDTATDVLDEEDLIAVGKKIKSLQSKACRLRPLAKYDDDAQAQLDATDAEITRLSSLRPNTKTTSVKSIPADELRAMLKEIDPAELPDDRRAQYEALIAKLG